MFEPDFAVGPHFPVGFQYSDSCALHKRVEWQYSALVQLRCGSAACGMRSSYEARAVRLAGLSRERLLLT